MSVRSIPFQDSVSVGTLVQAAALFSSKLPTSSGSRRAPGTVSARHLLDAISHSDKNIGDIYVGGLR
ncbi:Uncharacterised protein [Mycolicibacterium phlei]|uniref:hypothetical protein n=1 Tax=Mycobacteroides chelonae TaxID=1774 RepID=UPI000618A362|nr:hypothetical protein [Mycobacteroides chelonae]VEG19776.1 Uncharacterised protein [Mycolicibacterium phlei]AKC40245.1 hypothetical protein GR01_19020 [Mycobacteroides chelonae]ANB00974.1 hypothetical protein BB28_19950 [Mycobacteroides chelonae CCUG 47445]OLT82347.1 hypothetical protein BKG56_09740 [Mycobacteroides chelonae]ORV15907.1 hypothetical protein AWB96_07835 [Mycobacteroides chelonae]